MLNLSNFDLDFDDDFPSSIFGKPLVSDSHKNENVSDDIRIKYNEPSSSSFERISSVKKQILSSEDKNESEDEELKSNIFCYGGLLNFPAEKVSSKMLSNEVANLKRPSLQEQEHKKRRLTNERSVQRKFPGPAGILPDKPFKEIKDVSILMDKTFREQDKIEDKTEPIIYSQSSASVFLEPVYQKLVSDFDLNESSNPLSKYTIDWVKKTTMNKTLQGRKIPFLAAVLHCTNHSTPDPVLLLRDPTGEINGTLHRDVWADMGGKLKVGIALALRQVGVLITGVIRRQIYLNITMNNILALYSPSEDGTEIEVQTINKVSKTELLKSLEDWRAQLMLTKTKKNSLSSLFSLTGDSETTVLPHPERLLNSRPKQEVKEFRNYSQISLESKQREPNVSSEINKNQNSSDEILSNLQVVLSDCDFSDIMDLPHNNPVNRNKERNYNMKTKAECDNHLKEETLIGEVVSSKNSPNKNKSVSRETGVMCSQALSQAENLIFQEVLNGINLDEFEI